MTRSERKIRVRFPGSSQDKILNMKKFISIAFGLLLLSSCRSLVLEDRTACPSFLYFNVTNSILFEDFQNVFVSAFSYPDKTFMSCDTTVLSNIQDKSFYLEVKKSDAVVGHGAMGFEELILKDGSKWVVDEGSNYAPLYRFDYKAPARSESAVIPVEMVKDHSKVTVEFVNIDSFTTSSGTFPFYIVIKGNTCGVDGFDGKPIRGDYVYEPEEEKVGVFNFIVPRQFDRALIMELYAKPGEYIEEGLIRTFALWDFFKEYGMSWDAKNLADLYVKIDFVESHYEVKVMPWEKGADIIYEF